MIFSFLLFTKKNTKTTRKIRNQNVVRILKVCCCSACVPSLLKATIRWRVLLLLLLLQNTAHSTAHTRTKNTNARKNTGRSHKSSLLFLFFFFPSKKTRKKGDREGETGETRETERERDRRERTGRRLSPGTTKVPSFSTCTHSMLACLCVCVCVASLPPLSLFFNSLS